MKSYGDELPDFYDNEIPKVDSNHTCLAIISFDSALSKDENYYPQVLLKECKYIEKNVIRHINNNLSDSYSSAEYDDSDKEQTKDLRLMFERTILKIYFLREQF